MNFSSFHERLCSLGTAIIIYSFTFPQWLRERALTRYLAAKETLALMKAKVGNYEKLKGVIGDLEKEAAKEGAFASIKEKLDFKLSLITQLASQNDDLVTSNAKMVVAAEALEICSKELIVRAALWICSFAVGFILLIWGLVLVFGK